MPIHRYPGGVVNADNVTPGANQASGVWTLESQLQANGAGNWPQSTSQMSRSLRFNRSDSAYLTRTPAVTGNRRTWTWSGWIKKSFIGSGTLELFLGSASTGGATIFTGIRFIDDQLYIQDVNTASYNIWWVTSAVFRDPSSWYHIVVKYDTTQASSANAVGLWINGISQTITFTAASGGYVQNREGYVNAINGQYLGINLTDTGALNTNYFSGYMTEVVFVDGQALDATSFGYTDSNNVWQPKPYAGSVGTNGFYLTFADNTSNLSTGIGKDYSNRGNNWTPVNFSVASGAGNDSLVDVPTNWGTDTGLGGEVRGNYCTLNPLKQTGATLTNGNLQFTKAAGSGSTLFTIHSTLFVGAGKWYFEVTPTAVVSGYDLVGVVGPEVALTTYGSLASMTGNLWAYRNDAYKVNNGSSASYGNTWTSNDVIGVAIDMDNSKIWFSKNGTWQASGDPAAGTNAAYTNLTGSIAPLLIDQGAGTFDGFLNAGQRPFAYAAPSGFKALCTQNLPTPTVQDGGQYFNTVLYTGNGTTQSITGVGFQPDFVWAKDRTQAANHRLFDAVRGSSKILYSSLTNSETTDANGLTSFNSNGFSVGSSQINDNNYNYVAWNWKANGAGSSNTAGSRTSTVSVNSTSGFSIVTWNAGSAGNITVGHGLGVAPSMLIMKVRNAVGGWYVWFTGFTGSQYLILSDPGGIGTDTRLWANAVPTSTVFSLESGYYPAANGDMVAYCFTPVAGYSAFGSFIGNGSTDGAFVYTGFRPAFVMMKVRNEIGAGGNWGMFDNDRLGYNSAQRDLRANLSNAEGTENDLNDLLSNGFKIRSTSAGFGGGSGNTYIYAAFAENPFKIARAR